MAETKKWRAVYMPPGQNPFHTRGIKFLTRTTNIDASVPIEQVEAWARDVAEGNRFIRVEEIR